MRTRSVKLVTSWWVVSVWVVVTITTGLVSVVAVLQPTWYIRYSQIHAQDAQGVAFQVMVSSVGPLGYCRLEGVRQVTVVDKVSTPAYVEYSTPTPTNTTQTLWTSGLPHSSGASEVLLEPSQQVPSTPLPPTKTTKSQSQSTMPPYEITQPPFTTEKQDIREKVSVSSNGESASQTMNPITTTDSSSDTEPSLSAEVPLATPESFNGDGSPETDTRRNPRPKEPKSVTKTLKKPEVENSAPGIEVTIPSERHKATNGNSSRRRGKLPRPTTHTGKGRGAKRENVTAPTRPRKKKGKHRRRKKKFKKKRPGAREDARTKGRSRGAPRPEHPLHHLLRSMTGEQNTPLASPLQQPRQQEKILTTTDYNPRPPILYCSGVGGGVGEGSSAVWALVGVLYGVGGVVQVVVGVVALTMHLPRLHAQARKYILAGWFGNAQVAVVMSQGMALVLFPLGLGSPLARGECGGSSSVYWPGECSFGWSYMLGVVSTTLAAYCPCLARLTVFRRYDYKEWDSINFF